MAKQTLSDDDIAELLKKDARESSIKYSALGLQAFLPQRPTNNAPKPNTRFLRNILRETDQHNAALLKKEADEARARLRRAEQDHQRGRDERYRCEDHRPRKRRRVEPDDEGADQPRRHHHRHAHRRDEHHRSSKRSRGHERASSREPRRRTLSQDRDRHHRRKRHGSRSRSWSGSRSPARHADHRRHPSRPRHSRRSPSASRSASKANRLSASRLNSHAVDPVRSSPSNSDSDPLDAIIGPPPPPRPARVQPRGRGTFAARSAMDAHFSATYDPSADVHPNSDSENDWDQALEALRDRQRWKQQGADRLRSAGFSEEEVRTWEKGGEKGEEEVRWGKQGEGREWDRGKIVEPEGERDDGNGEIDLSYGRLKGT
ncbi:MAG: hypothetical protein M1817_003868 [Caeruleum heppii]|nr:MAG: hypothetical protein M1817_003868 [Caeruleum heppii]